MGVHHPDMEACLDGQQPVQRDVYKAFIRAEVLASEAEWPSSKRPAEAAQGGAGAGKIEGDGFRSSSSKKVASSGKVPKWMKVGR